MSVRYPRASRYPLKASRFHDLMPHRIREVLLVSSPYDAFILEEDGQLTEQVFFEYRNVSLAAAPRFTQVSSGEAALFQLQERRYDMVLTMSNPGDMDVNAFGRAVKVMRPGRPVVYLALNRHELQRREVPIDPQAVDGAFLWTGDSEILLAIIKYIEDRENVEHDIARGNVRVILLLEDSMRFYSSFMGILYKELMLQSHALYADGVNEHLRHMNMKSRPKILPARSYEEGLELFEKYRRNVMAIISDVRVPRGAAQSGESVLDGEAGIDFVRYVKRYDPDLPVLLQSAESENCRAAQELGAFFVDKGSTQLLAEIRNFLRRDLGFGDFVFRLQDFREVDRARDLQELAAKLAHIPGESVAYHASHNHFSIWLMARSEFDLAEHLRPTKLTDFANIEALRQYLIHVLRETHRSSHRGVVSDFSRRHFDHNIFSRLGKGSLGGKARGVAFLHMSMATSDADDFGGLKVSFPKTVVLATDNFDTFLEQNQLHGCAFGSEDDAEIEERFLAGRLPEELERQLKFIVEHLTGPLAVRSSSLLEDSLHQPFAGIYNTFMLPSNAVDAESRFGDLCNAIKLVYASTFFHNAKSYLQATGNRIEEEKMAVILQQVVGRHWPKGERFYPSFAGVAQSHNFYPMGPQKAEEGIVQVALGLGSFVVDGGAALRFNPMHPGVLPPFSNEKDLLDNTQRRFCAIDLSEPRTRSARDLYGTVRYFDLREAEEDGSLGLVGSVYSADDRRVREDLGLSGPRVVTFNNILRHRAIALPEALARVLELAKEGFGCAVEIEFACEMGDFGRRPARGKKRRAPILYLLQVRPLAALAQASREVIEMRFEREQTLCYSATSLGHGLKNGIRDLIYVCRETWRAEENPKIAQQVGELNEALCAEDRPYVLIGPGRWGTADHWLGIPVQWSQISSARVIIEASPEGYHVEPSQGSHFFQNMTALRLGYLTLPPGAEKDASSPDFVDWQWLDEMPAHRETEHLRHLRFEEPLTVVLNGQRGCGIVAKPGASPWEDGSGPNGSSPY